MSPYRLACACLFAFASLGAHGAGQAASKADPSIAPLLEELGYEYELDEDGDYKMVMALDGGRTQMVFIRSGVETYGRHRVREIWSPAHRADAGAFPGPVANRLLEASHALKLGAWVNNAGFAVLVVKVDAGIDAEALDQAIGAAVDLGPGGGRRKFAAHHPLCDDLHLSGDPLPFRHLGHRLCA